MSACCWCEGTTQRVDDPPMMALMKGPPVLYLLPPTICSAAVLSPQTSSSSSNSPSLPSQGVSPMWLTPPCFPDLLLCESPGVKWSIPMLFLPPLSTSQENHIVCGDLCLPPSFRSVSTHPPPPSSLGGLPQRCVVDALQSGLAWFVTFQAVLFKHEHFPLFMSVSKMRV